jgi:citrate lyase subunit beta/citryl-CoA lyase
MMMNLLRSFLFAPGSNEKLIVKALNSSADAVIIDLEDAVAVAEKENARAIAVSISIMPRNKPLYIRVNSAKCSFFSEDLASIIEANIDGIVLPKCEEADEILKVISVIKKNLDIIPLIESAAGLTNLKEIGTASKNISRFAFGAIDYTLDIGAKYTKSGLELLYPRSYMVIVSKVMGLLPPVDTVFPDLKDEKGLRDETVHIKNLGLFGKLAIHPKQISVINEIFTPAEDEIAEARKIVDAFNVSEKQGIASIELDGQFIDYPVYKKAQLLLELAKKYK